MTLISDLPLKTAADTDIFLIDQLGDDGKVTRADIVAGVAADIAAETATRTAEVATLTADKLDLAGGTMTGILTLSGAPTSNLHAVTKLYADSLITGKADLASPIFTGAPEAPTAAIATKSGQLASTEFTHNLLEGTVYNRTDIVSGVHTLLESETGYINVNFNGTVNITLPEISTLINPTKVRYVVKDTGFFANTTTRVISLLRSGADTIENGDIVSTITTPGETLTLTNDGVSQWFIDGVDTIATDVVPGISRLATSAEALALVDDTVAITPAKLAEVLDNRAFQTVEVGSAAQALTESDTGTIFVTYSATGATAITLPSVGSLVDPIKVRYEIVDAADNASTNNITISATAGNIDGQTSAVISSNGASLVIYNDGSEWRTKGNTQKAVEEAVAEVTASPPSPSLASTLGVGNTTGGTNLVMTSGDVISAGLSNKSINLDSSGALALGSSGANQTEVLIDGNLMSLGYNNASAYSGIRLTNVSANAGTLTALALTATRTWNLPDESGTLLTSATTAGLTTTTINIGDWNMDTIDDINIAHGLSATEWKTIRTINVIIRNDLDNNYYSLGDSAEGEISGFGATTVDLARTAAGFFDSVNFDSTSYNRGWITITYTKD